MKAAFFRRFKAADEITVELILFIFSDAFCEATWSLSHGRQGAGGVDGDPLRLAVWIPNHKAGLTITVAVSVSDVAEAILRKVIARIDVARQSIGKMIAVFSPCPIQE